MESSAADGGFQFETPAAVQPPHLGDSIRLAGAINETLDLRISVETGDTPVETPQLFVTAFTSDSDRIESAAASIFRTHPVELEHWPGWHVRYIPPSRRNASPMDVLVPIHAPRNGLPRLLPPNKQYSFWIDVAIPKTASPGVYRADIVLADGETRVASRSIQLEVWPFILPDESSVAALADLDHRVLASHHLRQNGRPLRVHVDDWRGAPFQEELDALLGRTLQMLASHGVTATLSSLSPPVRVTASDDLTVDWGQYDALVAPLLNGRRFFSGVASRYCPIPLQRMAADGNGTLPAKPGGYSKMDAKYVEACREHFLQQGWLDRAYALAPTIASDAFEAAEMTRAFSELVRAGSEYLAVATPLFPQDMSPFGWMGYVHVDLSDYVDVWMPPAQFFDAEAMRQQRLSGRRSLLTVDRPPFSGTHSVHAPPSYLRVLAWQAYTLGAEAFHLGKANPWPDSTAHTTPIDCVRFDERSLLYPGSFAGLSEPIPSARLKQIRRSLQDAAYLRLLEEHNLPHLARTMAQSLSPYAGTDAYRTHFADGRAPAWPANVSAFELARLIMAKELLRQTGLAPSQRGGGDLTRGVEWKRLIAATRRIEAQTDGVRLRLEAGAADHLQSETVVSLSNRLRLPVAGTVRLAGLAVDANTGDGDGDIGRVAIPPDGTRRFVLRSTLNAAQIDGGGHLTTPIEFEQAESSSIVALATTSLVTAHRYDLPIDIDGDLSDWPPGRGNVLSEFSLISDRSAATTERSGGSPPHNTTTGFVLRDGKYLYIAVNCVGGRPVTQLGMRRKAVQYTDMIPNREELVEILIDPLNAGTRSPSDLYHIVVKQSGPDLTERGIRFQPPCGESLPWAPSIDVATRVLPDRWTVELRVPLHAFGVNSSQPAIWGFNVTRFDAVHQEFSTWSGASHNAYDPMSLGNLLVR